MWITHSVAPAVRLYACNRSRTAAQICTKSDIVEFYKTFCCFTYNWTNITDVTSGFVCISMCVASLHRATRHPLRWKQTTSNVGLFIIHVNREEDVLTGCRPEIRTFSRNQGTNSKFGAPGKWYEANSILKTHKYYKPPKTFCRPRYLAFWICTPLL